MFQSQLEGLYKSDFQRPSYFPEGVTIMADDPMGWWGEVGTMLKYQYSPILSSLQGLQYENDPDFKPEEHINFSYENVPYLMSATSASHLNFLRKNQLRQSKIKQDIHQVRWHSMLVGALADPLNWLIPYSIAGKGIIAGMRTGARAGLMYGGASEALRAPFDPTNTATETITNIGATSAFGGLLGGGVRVPSAVYNGVKGYRRAKQDLEEITSKFDTRVRNTAFNTQDISKEYKVNIKTGKVQQTIKAKTGQQEGVYIFTTEKGSIYEQVKGSPSTIRVKKHSKDAGLKEASTKTIFVSPEQSKKILDYINSGGDWKLEKGEFVVNFYENQKPTMRIKENITPSKGKHPVEFWVNKKGKRSIHVGNKIINIKLSDGIVGGKVRDITEATPKQVDSRYVNAKYNRDTNTIHIDKEDILKQFKEKPWTKPKVEGVEPLEADAFKTASEWFNFVLMHEVTHSRVKKLTNESTPEYENRVNKQALKEFEAQRIKLQDKIETGDEWDLALPNPIGNIVSSPYRKAIQFIGKINKKPLPQQIKKYFHMGFADGGVLLKAHLMGKSVVSVQHLKGKAWGILGEAQSKLENLHYQQIKELGTADPNAPAPQTPYFGYKYRDKFWTQKNGNTFGEFLERAVTHYILNVSDETLKGKGKGPFGSDLDFSHLKYNKDTHFAEKPITKQEEKAGEVLAEFFGHYRDEALQAGLFDMNKILISLQNKTLPLFERTQIAISRQSITKKFTKRQKEKALIAVQEQIDHTKAKIKELTTKVKETDNFKPWFEENYFSRVWDREYILKHKEEAINLVEAVFKAIPFSWKRNKTTGLAYKKYHPKEGVRARAEKFVEEKMLGDETVENMSEMMAPLKVASLHPRSLNAPNWMGYIDVNGVTWRISDFMLTDPMAVMKNYTVRVAPKIEFKKIFGVDEATVMQDIELRMKAENFEAQEIADIKVMFDVLYRREVGQVVDRPQGIDNEFAQNVRAMGVVTFLSDSGRAAIVDAGNTVFQYGFKPFQHSMERMVSRDNWKIDASTRATGAGIIEKTTIGQIQNRVADNAMTHPVTRQSQRIRDRVVDFSMDLNFLRPLTVYFKTVMGSFAQHDIIDKSLRYNLLTAFEKANLARHGIGEEQARLIASQKKFFEQNAEKTRWIANVNQWSDKRAKDAFFAGNQTYINLGSLTATSADKFALVDGQLYVKFKPWMRKFGFEPNKLVSVDGEADMIRFQSGLMSLPFMFWNYGLSANQKILQAGFDPTRPLSQRLFGASIMIGLGYMVASWRMPDNMWDKMTYSQRLARAVHISGVTGMYTDIAYMTLHMYKGAGGTGPQNEFAMYNPDTFDAVMEPFGAGYGLLGDYGRGITTMATESFKHGLAQIPYPLQYNMFIRDEVREFRRMLRNS